MIPFHRRHTSLEALAVASRVSLGHLGEILKGRGIMAEPELTVSDEGDWSISIECENNTFTVHPTDPTHSRFMLFIHGEKGIRAVYPEPVPLAECLGLIT